MTLMNPVSRRFGPFRAMCAALVVGATLCVAEETQERDAGANKPVQSAPSTTGTANEPIRLSPFEVNDKTGDDSYGARKTLVGSRTTKDIIDIAANISIINLEQINDVNGTSLHDMIKFGVSGVTQNQSISNDDINIRGFRLQQSLRNGALQTGNRRSPLYDIERIEVIKGPAAMLTGVNVAVGGTVNMVTRAPSATRSGEVQATFADNNYVRVVANGVGPLYKSKEFSANYRVTYGRFLAQNEKQIQHDDETFLGGALTLYIGNNTSVLLNTYYLNDKSYHFWDDFLDLTSVPFTNPTLNPNPRLNQYSTESFSVGRQQDFFSRVGDWFYSVTVLSKLTENTNIRLAYNGEKTLERRRYGVGTTVAADNYTLNRQERPQTDDRVYNNLQLDLVYHLPFSFVSLDTMAGLDANKQLTDGRQSTRVIPALDTRSPTFPNDDAYFAATPFTPGLTGPGLTNVSNSVSDVESFSYYAQENATLLNEKLILVGGWRWYLPGGTTENRLTNVVTKRPDAGFVTHKYGIVYKVLPSLSVYGTDAETIVPQTGFTDAFVLNDNAGEPLHDQHGKDKEFGVKYDLKPSSRISLSGTVAHFQMELTNTRVMGTLPNGNTGNIQSAKDKAHGWEYDCTATITLGQGHLDLVAAYFDGDSSSATNAKFQAVNFTPTKYNVLAKYTWTTGGLRGLMVGGGMEDQSAKLNANLLLDWPATYSAFARYNWGKHWGLQLNLDNLTDERYIVMYSSTGLVQSNMNPFGARLTTKFRW